MGRRVEPIQVVSHPETLYCFIWCYPRALPQILQSVLFFKKTKRRLICYSTLVSLCCFSPSKKHPNHSPKRLGKPSGLCRRCNLSVG